MSSHLLTGDHVVALPLRPGDTVCCASGFLWLTVESRERSTATADWLLAPGRDFVAPAGGRVFVSRIRRHGVASFELLHGGRCRAPDASEQPRAAAP